MVRNFLVIAVISFSCVVLLSSLYLPLTLCSPLSALPSLVEHRDRFYLRNPISLVALTDHMSTVEVFAAATLDREERDYYQIVVEVSTLCFWHGTVSVYAHSILWTAQMIVSCVCMLNMSPLLPCSCSCEKSCKCSEPSSIPPSPSGH